MPRILYHIFASEIGWEIIIFIAEDEQWSVNITVQAFILRVYVTWQLI